MTELRSKKTDGARAADRQGKAKFEVDEVTNAQAYMPTLDDAMNVEMPLLMGMISLNMANCHIMDSTGNRRQRSPAEMRRWLEKGTLVARDGKSQPHVKSMEAAKETEATQRNEAAVPLPRGRLFSSAYAYKANDLLATADDRKITKCDEEYNMDKPATYDEPLPGTPSAFADAGASRLIRFAQMASMRLKHAVNAERSNESRGRWTMVGQVRFKYITYGGTCTGDMLFQAAAVERLRANSQKVGAVTGNYTPLHTGLRETVNAPYGMVIWPSAKAATITTMAPMGGWALKCGDAAQLDRARAKCCSGNSAVDTRNVIDHGNADLTGSRVTVGSY